LPERSFRYASLASGLDLVRKTLGRHEIATIQATAIDRDSGTIRLITTLAHGSGEWIASDWPVCPLADLPSPQRMGAALTYARRYALFTMVGIAGEDDLDAPDLPLQPASAASVNSASISPIQRRANGKSPPPKPEAPLDPETAARQCDALLNELGSISSFDGAAEWAKRIIALKNTLTSDHARDVETALETKLAQFGNGLDDGHSIDFPRSSDNTGSRSAGDQTRANADASLATQDRSSLSIGHPPRRRNKEHLKFVATQPCLLCGRRPSDAHHLKFAQPKAMGRKVSDEFTVPLCRTHHRELHRSGNELAWWRAANSAINPLQAAEWLWQHSKNQTAMATAISKAP
jgi:hypothetical protein